MERHEKLGVEYSLLVPMKCFPIQSLFINCRFSERVSFRPRIKYGVNSSRNPVFSRVSGCPRIKYPVSGTGQAKGRLLKSGMKD